MERKEQENHGLTRHRYQPPEYQIWSQIKQRCLNPNHPKYKNYGGRGIKMDPRWEASFDAFLKDVGLRPKKKGERYTIDRIDNDKGYFPGNVRWATSREQARNKRTNHVVTYEGRKMTIQELAEEKGVDKRRVQYRIATMGLSPEEAVNRPLEKGRLYFTYKGETHNLAVWARKLKKSYWTLHERLKAGCPVEEAFEKD